MIKRHRVVRESARTAGVAARGILPGIQSKDIPQEAQMTDRMLGRIEQAMDGLKVNGLTWRAKTMSDRGPGSEESEIGADFAVIIQIDVDGESVTKGFLGQSKNIGNRSDFTSKQIQELNDQCKKMLEVTGDAFVVIFSNNDIRVIPAAGFGQGSSCSLGDVYSRSIERFLEDFFECFCGDTKITSPSYSDLNNLKARYKVNSALGLRLST